MRAGRRWPRMLPLSALLLLRANLRVPTLATRGRTRRARHRPNDLLRESERKRRMPVRREDEGVGLFGQGSAPPPAAPRLASRRLERVRPEAGSRFLGEGCGPSAFCADASGLSPHSFSLGPWRIGGSTDEPRGRPRSAANGARESHFAVRLWRRSGYTSLDLGRMPYVDPPMRKSEGKRRMPVRGEGCGSLAGGATWGCASRSKESERFLGEAFLLAPSPSLSSFLRPSERGRSQERLVGPNGQRQRSDLTVQCPPPPAPPHRGKH